MYHIQAERTIIHEANQVQNIENHAVDKACGLTPYKVLNSHTQV